MAKTKDKFIFILIFLIALLFRVWNLAESPVHLSMDEASIGYNAYSILKTGKDEWGEFLPLAFKSVGDYKPPVNIYLTIPFVALLGLNEWSVRLPVAILGALSALVFALLLKELRLSKTAYIFGGLWFAISPWHTHFSRGSFEAVTALFFLLTGTLFFFRSLQKKSYFNAGVSVISFSLSIWAYHSTRLFVPLLGLFLTVISFSKLKFIFKNKVKLLLVFLTGVLLITPFIYLSIFTPAIKTRALTTSVFREQDLIRAVHGGKYESLGQQLFDNDNYLIFKHIIGKYLNYFDLRFWFWKGMQFTPPDYFDMGLFYLADILLILIGTYLVFTRKNDLIKKIALFWFLVGPIPASFTMNEQHPLRALVWLPVFGIVAALGFEYIYIKFRKVIPIYLVLLVINIVYFGDVYFRQFPRFFSEYWQYGYKEIALYACENQSKYKSIYISETFGSLGPLNTGIPYIYTLFYCKFDPGEYQKDKKTGNIYVRRFNLNSDRIEENTLIVGSQWDLDLSKVKDPLKIVKEIYYKNGTLAFIFIDTGKTKDEKK